MAKNDSSSSTTQTTQTHYTDQSVAAAEGSFAVGTGANVKVETGGKEIALASLETQRDTAGMALAANQNVSLGAIGSSERVAGTAIQTNAALATDALNTAVGLADIASRERSDVLNTTNLALQSNQGTLSALASLASGALERTQTPTSQTDKTLLYVVGAIGVAIALALAFAFRGSRK